MFKTENSISDADFKDENGIVKTNSKNEIFLLFFFFYQKLH